MTPIRALLGAACALCAVSALASIPSTAEACSPAPFPVEFRPDPEAWPDDVTPPAAITDVRVTTSASQPDSGCDSCGAIRAGFALVIVPPADDLSAVDDLGYRVTLVEGSIPDVYPPLDADLQQYGGPSEVRLRFSWDDADGDRGLDAVLRIEPIDGAGNVGPAFELPLRVAATGSGCSTHGGRQGPFPVLATVCLLFGWTRLRRR